MPASAETAGTSVSARALLEQIDFGTAPAILDARSRREFVRGRVPGALHVPFWTLPIRARSLPVPRDRSVVVYCGYGPRAYLAGAILRWHGFRHISYLKGHMAGWRRAGLREEKESGR